MRLLLFVALLLLPAGFSRAAARLPLELPVRSPDSNASRTLAPAYAGDVLELRLAPAASRAAWAARGADGPTGRGANGRLVRLGIAALDRAAAELGGVWFASEFPGESPPPAGPAADFSSFYIAHLPPGVGLEAALARFGRLEEVTSAEPIAILPVDAIPNDSLFASSYWFYQPSRKDIHGPEAWDVTTGDTSIAVAILDTGVLPYHPDLGGTVAGLRGQIWTNWTEAAGAPGVDDDGNGYVDDIHGWDFVSLSSSTDAEVGEDWRDPDNDPNDYAAHGTAVAGVVGALTHNVIGIAGTAWTVRLLPLRIGWACRGTSLGCGEVRMDFVAEAIRYATRNGARVINCSFESLNQSGLDVALTGAAAAGVTVVTSAGNNGQVNYMATRSDVISVASTGPTDVVSLFSNRGPQVDLAAPGEQIASTWMLRNLLADSLGSRIPAYRSTLSGTSLSAPFVAGAAALIQARQVEQGRSLLLPDGVLLRLSETADDISAQNPTLVGQYGSGRLDLFRAVSETWRSTVSGMGGRVNGSAAVFAASDGGTRVACATQNNMLVVLNGATLDNIATAPLISNPTSGVAAGPLSDAGGLGLFVGLNGRVAGLRPSGASLPGWPALVAPGVQLVSPAVGDLDGDGVYEVVSGTDGGEVWAWHVDGSKLAGFPVRVTPSSAVVWVGIARMTGTTGAQIVAAAQDGTVTVLRSDATALPGWPVTLSGVTTAPVETRIAGAPTVLVVVSGQLHALGADASERPGFPVGLGALVAADQELAIGDVDLDGHPDFAIVTSSPARFDVRDSTGASKSTLNWPRTLSAPPLGSPVLGHLSGGGAPEAMVMLASGLLALSNAADSLAAFPRPGGAGSRPSLADLDGDGTTEVIAGSGPLSPLLYIYDAGPASFAVGEPQPWPTFRGNYSRTGSADDAPALPVFDLLPPAAVTDLRAAIRGVNALVLQWTAPGNDGPIGRASAYDVRRSLQPIDAANFGAATALTAAAPGDPGTEDSLRVGGLTEGLTYYFAMRALDLDGNQGSISNVVAATLPIASPAQVADLRAIAVTDSSATLRWTASGEDGTTGRPRLYVVRAATGPITDASFLDAPYERIALATVDAGGTETLEFRFLSRGTRYWFALKAYDAVGNGSPLSNVLMLDTHVGGPLDGRAGLALAPGKNPSRVPAVLYWQADPSAIGARQIIRLYDLVGRRVRTLEIGTGVGGRVEWDGRDDRGNRVAAGLYVARLVSGGVHTQARLVLLP